VETVRSEVERRLRSVADRDDVAAAVAFLRDDDETTLATQIRITEVPAPPFQEGRRAAAVAALLEEAGLARVTTDEVGNVVAHRAGASPDERPLVVSAHLDTVFPAGTDVTVRRHGPLLEGPGISDDGRGLAALVALARALEATGIRTRSPLLFVATVGEEGVGDLRGVKGLFADGGAAYGAAGFISLDGAGVERIVTRGLGSRRFRVTVDGPGGHSWVDWGTPNPAHAVVELGVRLTALELSDEPTTTLTIARLGGGKSINAIPQSAWLEIDTRSPAQAALDELAARIRRLVREEAETHGGLEFVLDVIGDRPGGATDPGALLVHAAMASTELLGYDPSPSVSSTDANVPMKLGIPAITMGCGGDAGKAHTTEEWYRNDGGPEGIVRALYTILAAAGMEDD
jgi:acetylornithine deacetylase/succinyl-diaminopimelate desuccinylase-like protein